MQKNVNLLIMGGMTDQQVQEVMLDRELQNLRAMQDLKAPDLLEREDVEVQN